MSLTNTPLHPASYGISTRKISFPDIKQETFTYKSIPNATNIMYFNLVTQVPEKPATISNNEFRDLTLIFNNANVVVNKLARDNPIILDILWDFDQRNLTIKEYYRHYYGIQSTDKLTDEEQEFLIAPNLNGTTKTTQFILPISMQMKIEELYLVEDIGYRRDENHIVAFMKDTSFYSPVPLEQKDVVMVIAVKGNKILARQMLHSLRCL